MRWAPWPESGFCMYLSDTFQMLVRRWVLVIIGLIVTIGLVFMAARLVAPEYESKANVVLLPPQLASDVGANPYLSLAGLQNTSDIIARAMSAEETVTKVKAAGGSPDFEVKTDPTTSGPLLLITTQESTPEQSKASLDLLVAEVPVILKQIQDADSIKSTFQITSAVITEQKVPTVVRQSQVRAMFVAAVLGLLGSLLIISLIDSRLLRKKDGDEQEGDGGPTAGEESTGELASSTP